MSENEDSNSSFRNDRSEAGVSLLRLFRLAFSGWCVYSVCMVNLLDIQHQAEKLSTEDREGLLAYLIHGLSHPPAGADDAEILQREFEMDSGVVKTVSHRDFIQQVGRGEE